MAVTCRVLKLARQPYYRWLANPVTGAELAEAYRANALFDAKLAARVRLFGTGHNRRTDALEAHSIADVAVRTPGLRVVHRDVLRMRADRRDELSCLRVQTVNRLQRLLGELVSGKRKRDLSALQAKMMLAGVRPP